MTISPITNHQILLAGIWHLVEHRMSKKAVVTAIAVSLFLVFLAVGVLGWAWVNRERAAVASYRIEVPADARVADLVVKETELMMSREVLQPVIGELDLLSRWKLQTEEEALERLRSKLTVKAGSLADRVRVVYRDRNQERALEILAAINRRFVAARREASREGDLPPVVPVNPVRP